MPRPLKWSMLGAHTIILSNNIHKVTKTDYVWFEFLWIRRYYGSLSKLFFQSRHSSSIEYLNIHSQVPTPYYVQCSFYFVYICTCMLWKELFMPQYQKRERVSAPWDINFNVATIPVLLPTNAVCGITGPQEGLKTRGGK